MPEFMAEVRKEEEMGASPDAAMEEVAGELLKAIESKSKSKIVRSLKALITMIDEQEDETEME